MIALLLAVQLGSMAAPAPPTPAIARPTHDVKPFSDEEMVCRQDLNTGHRIASRTCRTRGEWKRIEMSTRDAFDRQLHHGQAGCVLNADC